MAKKIAKTPSTTKTEKKTTSVRGRRLHDDTVLHIAKTVKDEIGDGELRRFIYGLIAKVKSVTLAKLIATVSADKTYKERSHQDPPSHVRQLVNWLRRDGWVDAVSPKVEKTTTVAKKVVVVKAEAKPKTVKPVAKKPAAVAKKAVPAKTAKTAKRRVVLDGSKPADTEIPMDVPAPSDF
jgi:hypothetical protein